jgi:hypothetical protein
MQVFLRTSMHLSHSTGDHLLGVQFITSLKPDLWCLMYEATAQYWAFVFCSSGFEICNVLREAVIGPSPNPRAGGPGLCIYETWKHGGPGIYLGTGWLRTSGPPRPILNNHYEHLRRKPNLYTAIAIQKTRENKNIKSQT